MSQRIISRRLISRLTTASTPRTSRLLTSRLSRPQSTKAIPTRFFSTTVPRHSILPDQENPPPKESEPTVQASEPTPLEEDQYHTLADQLIEQIVTRVEEVQEGREDVDVEYSAGVLTVSFPPNGEYVINKQPPNKQIWLSSPVSGPKRFDWVVAGEGMQGKEGSGVGDWLYLRDGSSLSEILRKELGISVVVGE